MIHGNAASLGKARGAVRLVHGPQDLDKVQPGDILVASMTNPDYLMAMKRSAAIVTDHGGRLSHAAIVSREFGIPCMVNCGNAMKELNDGDVVTVDVQVTGGIVYV